MPDSTTQTDPLAAELTGLGLDFLGGDQPLYPDGKPGDAPDPKGDATPSSLPAPAQPAVQPPAPLDDVIEQVVRPPTTPSKKSRDYTGLPPEYHPLFERMSNEAYARLYPEIKEYLTHKEKIAKFPEYEKELNELREKTAKPPRYYDHEDSYMLDQTYRQGLVERANAGHLRDFWQQQLAKVEAGEPFSLIQQGADGRLTVTQPIQTATPQQKAFIIQQLMEANQQYSMQDTRLKQIADETRNTYKTYKTELDGAFNRMFGKHVNDLKPYADKILEILPAQIRGSQESRIAAYAIAALQIWTQRQQQQQQQAAITKTNKTIAQNVGPTQEQIDTGTQQKSGIYDPNFEKELQEQYGL